MMLAGMARLLIHIPACLLHPRWLVDQLLPESGEPSLEEWERLRCSVLAAPRKRATTDAVVVPQPCRKGAYASRWQPDAQQGCGSPWGRFGKSSQPTLEAPDERREEEEREQVFSLNLALWSAAIVSVL